MSDRLNLTDEQMKDRIRDMTRLRVEKHRARKRDGPPPEKRQLGPADKMSRNAVNVTAGGNTEIKVVVSPSGTTTSSADIVKRLFKLFSAGCSDAEVLAQMLPLTPVEINSAMELEHTDLEFIKSNAQAVGQGKRRLALQNKAEEGDIRANELIEQREQGIGTPVSCPSLSSHHYCPRCPFCAYLRAMTDEELTEKRKKLLGVLTFPRELDPKLLHLGVRVVEPEVPVSAPNLASGDSSKPVRKESEGIVLPEKRFDDPFFSEPSPLPEPVTALEIPSDANAVQNLKPFAEPAKKENESYASEIESFRKPVVATPLKSQQGQPDITPPKGPVVATPVHKPWDTEPKEGASNIVSLIREMNH